MRLTLSILPGNVLLSRLQTNKHTHNHLFRQTLLSVEETNETYIAMNIPTYSRVKPNSTVKEIVNELMVEQWITNISYEKYYAQCAPILCTHSRVE